MFVLSSSMLLSYVSIVPTSKNKERKKRKEREANKEKQRKKEAKKERKKTIKTENKKTKNTENKKTGVLKKGWGQNKVDNPHKETAKKKLKPNETNPKNNKEGLGPSEVALRATSPDP